MAALQPKTIVRAFMISVIRDTRGATAIEYALITIAVGSVGTQVKRAPKMMRHS
ncbi:MAG TPA: hypothetical protein VGR52_02245 [Stellaceae bacterium]|nr:hypothetical protein [Stellaceae bacterium]